MSSLVGHGYGCWMHVALYANRCVNHRGVAEGLRPMSAKIEAIIADVVSAFAGVPRGTITLHEAEAIDDYGTEAQREKARKRDSEEDWQEVPDASLAACQDALSHLDPIGWRFYLPAFMRYSLKTLASSHSPIDRVIYTLAYHDDRELNDYKRRRFETLDVAQAQVVNRFLELASTDDARCDSLTAKQALQQYWLPRMRRR